MNANELADELEVFMHRDLDQVSKLHLDAATMLRQQQAEIEALKQSKSDGNNKVNFELTDEEIMDIWNSLFKDFSIDIGMFARAILLKAQEK